MLYLFQGGIFNISMVNKYWMALNDDGTHTLLMCGNTITTIQKKMSRDASAQNVLSLCLYSLMWLLVHVRVQVFFFFHVVEPAIFPYGILSSHDSFKSYPRNSLSFWAHIHFLSHCYLWNQNGTECDAENFSPWQMVRGFRANSVHNSQQRLSPSNLSCAGYCPEIPLWEQTGAFAFIRLPANWDEHRNRISRQLRLTWRAVLEEEGPRG